MLPSLTCHLCIMWSVIRGIDSSTHNSTTSLCTPVLHLLALRWPHAVISNQYLLLAQAFYRAVLPAQSLTVHWRYARHPGRQVVAGYVWCLREHVLAFDLVGKGVPH
jgi:hypothetical protein